MITGSDLQGLSQNLFYILCIVCHQVFLSYLRPYQNISWFVGKPIWFFYFLPFIPFKACPSLDVALCEGWLDFTKPSGGRELRKKRLCAEFFWFGRGKGRGANVTWWETLGLGVTGSLTLTGDLSLIGDSSWRTALTRRTVTYGNLAASQHLTDLKSLRWCYVVRDWEQPAQKGVHSPNRIYLMKRSHLWASFSSGAKRLDTLFLSTFP
jgi:hypothetical protein